MFEAPERVTTVLTDFIDDCVARSQRQQPPAS